MVFVYMLTLLPPTTYVSLCLDTGGDWLHVDQWLSDGRHVQRNFSIQPPLSR